MEHFGVSNDSLELVKRDQASALRVEELEGDLLHTNQSSMTFPSPPGTKVHCPYLIKGIG